MLKRQIEEDLKQALKQQERAKISTLRLLLAEIKNKEIDKKGPLIDEEIWGILSSGVKMREEAIAQFRQGKREDLVKTEQEELGIIKTYLPAPLDQDQLLILVKEAVEKLQARPQDFGKVMKVVMTHARGRASGSEVRELVKSELSAQG